jgi:5-formyltetrahydrofolate cyclo-ligase
MSDAVRRAKAELRAALRERRRELDPADVARWSAALCQLVLSSAPWHGARTIAAFVGVKNEPDTMPLLHAAPREGKRLLLPRVRKGATPTLDFVEVVDPDVELVPGSYGLREPSGDVVHDLTTLADLDLVLVPGLAFSSSGDRIGLGPGYYDRALAAIAGRPRPLRMGLCFAAFLDPTQGPIPTEPTDIPVHAVATDVRLVIVEKNVDDD